MIQVAAERRLHVVALSLTVAVHVGALVVMFVMQAVDASRANARPKDFVAIEAGLAFKEKGGKGPITRQPQKDPPKQKKEDELKIAKNPDDKDKKDPGKKDEKKPEDPSLMDPEEARRQMEARRGKPSAEPSNEAPQAGQLDGSEWGTLEKAKGDPYIGELVGKMTKNFTVPSVVKDENLTVIGCVKIDAEGKIVDRSLAPDGKSASHAFNSAVEERLRVTKDMDKPVPSHLKDKLVGIFVCHPYRN